MQNTIQHAIDFIKNKYSRGASSQDIRLEDALILQELTNARSRLLSEKFKLGNMPFSDILLTQKEVTLTSKRLPNDIKYKEGDVGSITYVNDYLIDYVGDENGFTTYSQEKVENIIRSVQYSHYRKHTPKYAIKKEKILVYNADRISKIYVRAVFNNMEDYIQSGCDYSNTVFPIDANMLDDVFDLVTQSIYNEFGIQGQDVTGDGVDNIGVSGTTQTRNKRRRR